MKTKLTIILLCIALVTLSFTFATRVEKSKTVNKDMNNSAQEAPIGGFALDSKS
jgi:hypothetical protein